jgi:hypothetical protein
MVAVNIINKNIDSEADVAKYKGIVEAIETAQIKNKCK